jgi:tetratricopeptide (TPR) repeat protein
MVRIAFALLFLVAAARAEENPGAQAHFENGRALYRLHKFEDAVREFNLGYAQLPLPEFLLDIGLAYRGLGDLPRARDAYRRFLDEAPQDHPRRKAAAAMLADLERAIVLVKPSAPPAPSQQSPPPQKRTGLIAALISVGVVVLVGAVVGIYFASSPRDPTPSLGETVFHF